MEPSSVILDRYRLEERIGVGGMGVVWKATDLLLDQLVALKRITLAGVDTEQVELTRARALREARAAARLRGHPHVVATYDVCTEDSTVWLCWSTCPPAA
jgi:eukaryotic-like serine/threonine-protein kinase